MFRKDIKLSSRLTNIHKWGEIFLLVGDQRKRLRRYKCRNIKINLCLQIIPNPVKMLRKKALTFCIGKRSIYKAMKLVQKTKRSFWPWLWPYYGQLSKAGWKRERLIAPNNSIYFFKWSHPRCVCINWDKRDTSNTTQYMLLYVTI
jgi:hypothetical protein